METFTRFGEYSILPKKHFGRALGQKKSSLISGNRPGETFLLFTRLYSGMCIRIYLFNFKKQTNNKKTQESKKQKKLKKKREYLRKID